MVWPSFAREKKTVYLRIGFTPANLVRIEWRPETWQLGRFFLDFSGRIIENASRLLDRKVVCLFCVNEAVPGYGEGQRFHLAGLQRGHVSCKIPGQGFLLSDVYEWELRPVCTLL